jgi:predicted transcriptional regulator
MRKAGLSIGQIAEQENLPKSTVQTVLQNFKKRGTVDTPKVKGRPQKLSDRNTRALKHLILKDRRASLAELTNNLPISVSRRTVQRTLKKLDFDSRIAVKKPYLNEKHIAQRLEFAKVHENWNVDDWSHVIWTDESSFEIGKFSRQIRVWRRAYEKYNWDCLAPTFKSGRVSVMVWGAFTADDKCILVHIPSEKRKAKDFVEIVYEPALAPFYYSQTKSEDFILMEDGAPVHRSLLPNQWLAEAGIPKMNWPANSPDLNPMENVWKIVKDAVQKAPRPKNAEEMLRVVNEAWKAIPQETLRTLVGTMRERMEAVVAAKGRSTRW